MQIDALLVCFGMILLYQIVITNLKFKIMDKLIVKGKWNLVKGKLKEKYGQLTDDDLQYAEGKEDQLIGRLQEVTGRTREELIEEIKNL